ncbi:rhodanese-like domain-containing protein [Aliivibrio kagoshimensis]|uniref:rhodanese-like domain-containing protein n=1 Tax=Aliivibrio kagoshimensis TaxID=2910230 RepID=UPI003D129CE9
MFKKIAVIVPLVLTLPFSVGAKEIVGKVQSAIHMSKVIQYVNPKTKKVDVIKYDNNTVLVDAESFKDFTINTKFKAEVDDKGYASQLKRVLVKLPADQLIDTETLADLLEEGEPVFVGDARPIGIYNAGHIPTAKATPSNKLADNLGWLPKDKEALLVFYCGGVTCPLSPAALKIAKQNGYTNAKAYVEGFPAWKGEVYPAHINADWVKKNLDIHHIILDVRHQPSSFITGAVHMPASELADMHERWNEEKKPVAKRTIFDLRDKKAPIIIVADDEATDEAIEAYEILTFWKFKNVTILAGGMEKWVINKLPIELGSISTQLVYEKKLVKGAIEEAVFVKAVKQGGATIIDVRNADEVADGHLKGSINIPLAVLEQNLAKIPKNSSVILHCAAGARASLGYTLLTKRGYTNITFLNDSFKEVAKENGIELI